MFAAAVFITTTTTTTVVVVLLLLLLLFPKKLQADLEQIIMIINAIIIKIS